MDDIYESIKKFMTAQGEAEKAGKDEFVCPLCGGRAVWVRSTYNNHLQCGCWKCGFNMME